MPKSSDREPISQIVELVRRTHFSDRRARPSNPFLRSSSSSIIKPIHHRSSRTWDAPFVKPKIVPPNRRSACSGSILLWWRGWFLFCWSKGSYPSSLNSWISDFIVETKCMAFKRSWECCCKVWQRTLVIPIISFIKCKIKINSNDVNT